MWLAVKVYSDHADMAVIELTDQMLEEVRVWREIIAGARLSGIETASFRNYRAEFLRDSLGCGDAAFQELNDRLSESNVEVLDEHLKCGRHVHAAWGLAVCGIDGMSWSAVVHGVHNPNIRTQEVLYGILEGKDE
jgi:hypothetical protein